jgi:putative FmdB family regulatory protein
VPVYEYRCASCGETFDEVQPMGSSPPEACPHCGAAGLKRVYGRVAVTFSGWGFNRTDNLVPNDGRRRDFKKLKEKAEEISSGD